MNATLELDAETCERARLSRDPRFDGRFFVAVLTTGIYCRPICPVKLPRADNVRFVRSAAEAMEQGFRPCLRCRPELAPGHPYWPLPTTLARAALQRIQAGALDGGSLEDLAAELGVTGRHLRRLLVATVGASPVSLAQSRRVAIAKQLLSDGDMRMADVAMAAGFGSVRRFNSAFQQVYGRSPRDIRRVRKAAAPGLQLRLSYRPPYDWARMRAFLAQRALRGLEDVSDAGYRRWTQWQGRAIQVHIEHLPRRHSFALSLEGEDLAALLPAALRARRLLDLDADPHTIATDLTPFGAIATQINAGLRVPGAWDRFELAVRAVLGQQVSVAAARTLAQRLLLRCGRQLPGMPAEARLFPRPEDLLSHSLDGLGLTGARVRSLQALSHAIVAGELDLNAADPARILGGLARLPGFGPWTRGYIAMRALADPDAWPSNDGVLRKRLDHACARDLDTQFAQYRPWRAYATLATWHLPTEDKS